MKKNYQQPEIWVEQMNASYHVLAGSIHQTDEVIKTTGNAGIEFGGPGGEGQSARANNYLWDDGDEE